MRNNMATSSSLTEKLLDEYNDDMYNKASSQSQPWSANPVQRRKITLKYASLITLTVQNAALNLTMRAARTQKDLFLSSTAVIVSEIIKILTCLVVVWLQEGSWTSMVRTIKIQIIDRPRDTLKVSIPSIVYYIQNNLIYLAATHLDAATAQVTYQLKILTTAIFSVLMLGKTLHHHQWVSLFLLFVGVALVQVAEMGKSSTHHDGQSSTSHNSSQTREQSPFLGFMAILSACCLSGFAGVYFEKILKGTSEVSLWVRNLQLAFFAIPFGFLQVFVTSDYDSVSTKGFFFGYTFLTWVVVLLQAQGGLLVAVVVKYADNILKGFSTSLSIILSCVASVYLFSFHVTGQFVLGAGLVIASIFLYGKAPNKPILPVVMVNGKGNSGIGGVK